ncbi:MAG TPA: uroporphyrinogen-III synthase [Ktedonobacterales bacterium]|nr:uroporphyrinogen-III synthase [Ktedonobacterales bacterium]
MSAGEQAPRPLAGRHIAITRPEGQAGEFAALLEAAGARVSMLPAIDIAALEDTSALDAALRELASFDWIALTSVNGVAALDGRLRALGLGWGARGLARIAAIGPATAAALEDCGVVADLVPAEYVAEAILDGMGNVAGQRVLLARADIARRTLAEGLRVRGAEVVELAAYRTIPRAPEPERLRALLADDRPDALTFTASSTVRGLLDGLAEAGLVPSEALAGIALACIGPITAATLRDYGQEPEVVASEYTTTGLRDALISYFTPAAKTARRDRH